MNQKLENLYLVHDRFNNEYRHIKEQNDRLKMSDEEALIQLEELRTKLNAALVQVLTFNYDNINESV